MPSVFRHLFLRFFADIQPGLHSIQNHFRIPGLVALPQFKVQMRTCGPTGTSHLCNFLASSNLISNPDQIFTVMPVKTLPAPGMINNNKVTVPAPTTGKTDCSRPAGRNRTAYGSGQINTGAVPDPGGRPLPPPPAAPRPRRPASSAELDGTFGDPALLAKAASCFPCLSGCLRLSELRWTLWRVI